MSRQLLIYDGAKAVSSTRHRDWSVKSGTDYGFASEVNSVPLTAVEFAPSAPHFPIVFAGDEQLMPLAMLGLRNSESRFVDAQGHFDAPYVPAFLRRYPFVFSSQDEGRNFTLCIDESYAGCNQENRGERLFDADGERTTYLNRVLEFLKEYQVQFARTQAFCKSLDELELLEPMTAQLTPPSGGERITLTGFKAINREKLKALPGETLEALMRNDGMELIFWHLQSLNNFKPMLQRAVSPKAAQPEVETAEAE